MYNRLSDKIMNTIKLFRHQLFILILLEVLLQLASPVPAHSFDWVPTDEEIKKYRQSWNPLSHGPVLLQAVDIQPKGQLSIREFLFSQIGESSFGNQLGGPTDSKNGPVHLYQVSPSINTSGSTMGTIPNSWHDDAKRANACALASTQP